MLILPAIDIKDGKTVRLFQGDYNQVTTYDAHPVQVAHRWQAAGASWLHIVDLDGAKAGQPVNDELIAQIRAATSLHIEFGGGMRSLAHIEKMLNMGIERVILGTIAVTDRPLLEKALTRWGERIAVGLDARHGQVAIAGWRETSHVQAAELASALKTVGVQRFIYTDIARDGALKGPNLEALREMQQALAGKRVDKRQDYSYNPKCRLIASGGISSIDDLRSISALGIEGAIIGKALYTGDVDLAKAIQEIER